MASLIATLWRWFANLTGIAALSGVLAYGIMASFSHSGPVVEVISGPPPGVRYAPYNGTISYEITTVRHESCPGTNRTQYIRVGPTKEKDIDSHSVSTFSPVMAYEIRPERTALIERILPESLYPGRWLYRETINSRCPMREHSDIIAEFEIEVVPGASPERIDLPKE